MSSLNLDWKPNPHAIVNWFAMDKIGNLAYLSNVGFGNVPRVLLKQLNINKILGDLNDFIWDDSNDFKRFFYNKNGAFILDSYSSYTYREYLSRDKIISKLSTELTKKNYNYSDANLAAGKGCFVYFALEEGTNKYRDYPIGYDGPSKMGDYFRYLIPTIKATIEDIPESLRKIIPVSDTLDFATLRLLDNNTINDHFKRLYQSS